MEFSSDDVRRLDPEEFSEEREELRGEEGLACRGAAQPEGYANGVTSELIDEGIAPEGSEPSDLFDEVILRELSDGRQDVIMPFAEDSGLDFGKMAMWRLQSPFTWVSDYLDQEPVVA